MITARSFAIAFLALAAAALQFPPAHANPADEAGKYIEKVATQALDIISSRDGRDAKQVKLEKLFSQNVNIPWVARFVMGRHWRQATDDQKKRYLTHYESFLIRHYTSRFADYTGGIFAITGVRETGEGEYTVSMSLQGSDGKNSEPVLVDYRVRKEEGGRFRIFDVIVEGVSMITTQRSEFASVISQHDVDYLIEQLASKSVPSIDSGT